MTRIIFLIKEAFVSLRRNLLIVAGAILADGPSHPTATPRNLSAPATRRRDRR